MEDLGEGPSTEVKGIAAYQLSRYKFDHTDIRFTTKGDALYAFALGWPADNQILIKSLASSSQQYDRQIRKIELLGAKGEVTWTRGADGLSIRVTQDPPCRYAYCFKILPA